MAKPTPRDTDKMLSELRGVVLRRITEIAGKDKGIQSLLKRYREADATIGKLEAQKKPHEAAMAAINKTLAASGLGTADDGRLVVPLQWSYYNRDQREAKAIEAFDASRRRYHAARVKGDDDAAHKEIDAMLALSEGKITL